MMTKAPPVALVNEFFARKVFGSPTNAVGQYFKRPDGTRLQFSALSRMGNTISVAEDPQPAMFLPILQSPTSSHG